MRCIRIALLLFLIPAAALAQEADTVRLSLHEALTMARSNGLESRRADALRRQADAAVLRSLSPPPPEVSLEYAFVPRGAALSEYGERSIALEQELPSPFALVYRHREASAVRRQVTAETREALRDYHTRVTTGYYRLAAQYRRVAIAEQLLASAAFEARAAEVRFDAGDAARTELLAARTMRTEAENVLTRRRAEADRERISFTVLLGVPAAERSVYVPADSLALPVLVLADAAVRDVVISHSPAIRAAHSALEAARAASSLAVANLFPSFTVGVMDQREAGSGASYGVSVGLSVPLWFALDNRGAMNAAEARVAEAQVRLEATELALRGWVDAALTEFHARRTEAERYRNTVLPEARELLELTTRGWSAGETSFFDVIQARRYYSSAADDALTAIVACLETWTEIQSLLNLEEE